MYPPPHPKKPTKKTNKQNNPPTKKPPQQQQKIEQKMIRWQGWKAGTSFYVIHRLDIILIGSLIF